MRPTVALLALCITAGARAQEPASPPQQTVSLRVLDLDGKPIEGAGVAIGDDEGAAGEPTADQALQRPLARSDRDGNLSFAVTAPQGPFAPARFVLAAKGYASLAVSWDRPEQMAAASRLGVIHLYPGSTLRGRVRDADGQPVAGARIELRGSRRITTVADVNAAICSVATTDADGIYALAGAPTGPCRLTVSKPGYYAEQLFPVWADTPSSPVLHRSGYVSGRLVDADPRHCRINLYTMEAAAAHVPTPPANADGSFRLPLANRGPVQLQVYDDRGFVLAQRELQGPAAGIELPPSTHALRIRVTTAGKPVPKFTVQPAWGENIDDQLDWRRQFPTHLRGTDGVDGAATLTMPTSASCGVLQVQAEGCAIARVSVPSGDVQEVTCALQAGASLAGVVTDENGAPVAGARVFAQCVPKPDVDIRGNYLMPRDPAVTGPDGRYCLEGLPSGRFAVVVDHADFEVPEPQTCDVDAGEHAALDPVQLQRAVEILGRLHGKAPAGAMVAIASPDPLQQPRGFRYYSFRAAPSAEIASDGRFVLHGLQHGPQALVLRLPPSHPEGTWIELPLGSFTPSATEQVIEVTDAEPATLRGAIQGDFGDAARSWRVVALRKIAGALFALPCAYADVDGDGRYAMRLAPGDYRIGVIDLRSGAVLHRDAAELKLSAGQQLEADLAPDLHRADIDLHLPAGELAVTGTLQLRAAEPRQQRITDFMVLRADFNQGLPLMPGQSRLRFYLPAETFTASVLAYAPSPGADGRCESRRGEASFTVDGAMTVTVPLIADPAAAK